MNKSKSIKNLSVEKMEEMIACALSFARSYQKYDDDPNQAKRLLDDIIKCLEAKDEDNKNNIN